MGIGPGSGTGSGICARKEWIRVMGAQRHPMPRDAAANEKAGRCRPAFLNEQLPAQAGSKAQTKLLVLRLVTPLKVILVLSDKVTVVKPIADPVAGVTTALATSFATSLAP